ncbi:permease-like cell division protein FtsX [Planobispora siamensis]|nr:permease-like cell division protein FtsX [Planobispora siamensis]
MSFPDHQEPGPGYEELSFGDGDPDRESRLQVWLRTHTRLLTACAVVLVLIGASVVGGRHLYERSREPLPPPEARDSGQVRVVVHLCGQRVEAWSCLRRGEVTDADGQAIAARMRAMPELADVAFVSKEEDSRRSLAYYAAIGEPERADELFFHASVEAVLRRGEDFKGVADRLKEIPGVVAVFRELPDAWEGKADLAVALCAEGERPARGCQEGRTVRSGAPATEAEKEAILDRLWDLPGVETVYLQKREDFMRLKRQYEPQDPAEHTTPRVDRTRATFYVKLADPAGRATVAGAVKDLPGVGGVYPVGYSW